LCNLLTRLEQDVWLREGEKYSDIREQAIQRLHHNILQMCGLRYARTPWALSGRLGFA
jgi:hypothetical protein